MKKWKKENTKERIKEMETMEFNLVHLEYQKEERGRERWWSRGSIHVICTYRWTGYCLTVMGKRNTDNMPGEKLLKLRHDINRSISPWAVMWILTFLGLWSRDSGARPWRLNVNYLGLLPFIPSSPSLLLPWGKELLAESSYTTEVRFHPKYQIIFLFVKL